MFQNIVGSEEMEEVILNKDIIILIWHIPASELCINYWKKVWFLLRDIINNQETTSEAPFQKQNEAKQKKKQKT